MDEPFLIIIGNDSLLLSRLKFKWAPLHVRWSYDFVSWEGEKKVKGKKTKPPWNFFDPSLGCLTDILTSG